MKNVMSFLLLPVLCGFAFAGEQPERKEFAIAIHGGAGRISSDPDHIAARQAVLEKALTLGKSMLKNGDSSLQTVEAVIRILEDAPEFNSGLGAVLNAAGTHELDASIMDGKTRKCGAVAGVRTVRHPITLARHVMTETRHVLLATDGAERFADELGEKAIERVTNDWFSTERQKANLKRAQAIVPMADEFRIGTVGCVALDKQGNIAAGTSTGGLTNKKFGRVGDSPIVGAGTYADNKTCGVSCTGVGEDFIRNSIAFHVAAQMEYGSKSVVDSVHHLLHHPSNKISGGIIAVAADGTITMQFNTAGMSRAAADSSGLHEVHIIK